MINQIYLGVSDVTVTDNRGEIDIEDNEYKFTIYDTDIDKLIDWLNKRYPTEDVEFLSALEENMG